MVTHHHRYLRSADARANTDTEVVQAVANLTNEGPRPKSLAVLGGSRAVSLTAFMRSDTLEPGVVERSVRQQAEPSRGWKSLQSMDRLMVLEAGVINGPDSGGDGRRRNGRRKRDALLVEEANDHDSSGGGGGGGGGSGQEEDDAIGLELEYANIVIVLLREELAMQTRVRQSHAQTRVRQSHAHALTAIRVLVDGMLYSLMKPWHLDCASLQNVEWGARCP